MGIIYMKDKPESDIFSHIYAESSDGSLIRIPINNVKTALGVNNVITSDENSEIVSWIENTDTGIKVFTRDGNFVDVPLSQAKEFETVEFDTENHYLHFYDANGNDVYDPVYIEGGGGSSSSSVIKLINQNGSSTITVASGSSVNIMFSFTSTEGDASTGDGTCQISINGSIKSTFTIEQGQNVVDVSSFLNSGSNTVRVKCTDIYGNYKTLIYTVSIIDMYIESTFDATIPYSGSITYKYTPYGALEKTIHILIDGNEINNTVITTSGKQITYMIPTMQHGIHRLEVYATATMNESYMESEHLIYDLICIEDDNVSAMISSVYETKSVKQGELISIPHIVYDPKALACDITRDIYTIVDGSEEIYSTQSITVDRSQQHWNTRKYPVGTVYFRIKYGDISRVHTIEVSESDIKIEIESNDLELNLISEGRSNSEANPGTWVYGDYTTTLTDFDWKTNGWMNDDNGDACLRLNGDARAEVQFKPFDNDIRTYGKTIEIEFAIRDVNSRGDTVISCLSGGIGFEIKADTAYIKSEQSKVFCNYKDEEKVKLAFVVESRSEHRLLSIYLNGILSDTIQYPDSDNFQQSTPVNISIGSSKCGVDLYTIRSYATALTFSEVVNNTISDIKDIVEKTTIYERNDIYDEYGNISFEKCKAKNSVMVIVGELPESKGDKQTVTVKYYDIDDETINYIDEWVTIDVQGTSSQYYVRKNWKLKFSNEHYIDKQHLPASVICIKVDYAEATGTHNTQNANFVETLYSEPIPPQENNPLCRTTIYGKPILLFHQADENSDPVFYGKANYNYDKGAEHVFGFTSDYDVECWEFCNNTSNACNFLGEIPSVWKDDFESRYPENYTNINRFKLMHDWVVSTRQDAATGEALSETFVDADGVEYTTDTAEYRLAKFKMEFEEHFDMHYSLVYYVYTFFALMVDQRAKNMFMTYWGETGKWQPWFYDNDTSFGINNEGQLVFDYYHQDTDKLEDANVYNGQNSVLWVNFREAFPDEIKEMYQNLRNNKLITYDKLVEQFITNGSDKWSESIYNEDSDFKYISMLKSEGDATNLPQVRGSGEEHFRYFVENRLNFCDSKWYASDYANDYISLRIYTPSTWSGVEPNPTITVKPFSTMYAGVRYKANGTLYQQLVEHDTVATFTPQGETFESENNETFNDTETAIYGAHLLSSIGDLAPLYCGSVNVSNADKLIELKVGDSTDGYSNANLKELSVGTNKLLKKLDVRNCPNFATVLGLSGCPNIEEVYATGTSITGVELSEAGCLRIIHLPGTITNLTLKNQLDIEDLIIAGYENIKTLWIENCPTVEELEILNSCVNVERLRLTDVEWTFDTASEMLALAERTIGGIDENGTNIDTMWIDGTCHIKTLTGAEYLEIKAAFPYINITYDSLTAELIFMSDDGITELTRQTIRNGGNGTDPVTAGTISRPTKTSTAQYDYTYAGWSLTPGGSVDATALNGIEADRKVYAAFTSTIRSYTVRFYNGTTLLQTSTVQYGGSVSYTGSTPENNTTGNTDDFEFYGWRPSPTNIQENTDCYAQYHDLRIITDSWATIYDNVAKGTAADLYVVGSSKILNIGEKEFIPMQIVAHNHDELADGVMKWTPTLGVLPYSFAQGSAVILNNEIHILGSYEQSSYYKNHYKWNGTDWVSVSTLPYNFYQSSAVVLNGEIHILGSYANSSYYKNHYKWNGTDWVSVSTLPYNFYRSKACVLNNEIHILGTYDSSYETSHYKYDAATGEWVSVSTLPYTFKYGEVVVYNNEIHILGGSGNNSKHYKYDPTNSSWVSVSTLPYNFYQSSAVVHNGSIHILGSYNSSYRKKHYAFDGTSWTIDKELPYNFYDGCALVYNDKITILGSNYDGFYQSVSQLCGASWELTNSSPSYFSDESIIIQYKDKMYNFGNSTSTSYNVYDGSTWSQRKDLPYKFYSGAVVVYNNELHLLGGSKNEYKHCKFNGTEWTTLESLPYKFYSGTATVYNNEIHLMGSYESSYIKTHYKWDGSTWVKINTDLPFTGYGSSAVVYNNEIHLISNRGTYSEQILHYKFNGTGWTSVSTLPISIPFGTAFVHNNEIHIFGSTSGNDEHYKWNGVEWIFVETLPIGVRRKNACVYNSHIYIFSGYNQYVFTNPKATLTFIAGNLLNDKRYFNGIESGLSFTEGYRSGSESIWAQLNNDIINNLPSELINVIAQVNKLYNNSDQNILISADKLWVPSLNELGINDEIYAGNGCGTAYDVFTDSNSRVRTSVDGSVDSYMTRTIQTHNSVYTIYPTGLKTQTSQTKLGVLIGFCI